MRKTHPKKKCPKPLYAWNFAWESIENTTSLLAQNTEIHLTGKGWKSVTPPLVLAGRAWYMKSVDFSLVAGGVWAVPKDQRDLRAVSPKST